MKEISILQTKDMAGKEADLFGWVANRRDHGKLVFIDLRDRSGVLQVVFSPKTAGYDDAQKLRNEWVVRIKARIKERPEKMRNPDLPTGGVEAEPLELEILNEAETPVMPLDTDGYEIGEETRLQYRYADLRRPRLATNLIMRHAAMLAARNWLAERDFSEIETPVLTKSTPEGARDYVVPSRLYPGMFFALPQSPQQYKQLLMAAGAERYFQFARCFRDEDTRGDRQPEFTQLDMEMSFVGREDVMRLNEDLLIHLVSTLWPNKRIQQVPFPVLSYGEAMAKYETDRPDLREDPDDPDLLAFCWVVDFPFFEKTDAGGWTFTHNPFSAPKAEHAEWLLKGEKTGEILTSQYDVVLNGMEIGGGSIRAHRPDLLRAVFSTMGFADERIEANFGHMLEALASGTPPHGGIAWGWDRFMAIMQNEPNIREVIAFPKTGDARDLMMQSPSELPAEQLKELKLSVGKK
ncbi:MAG TPA: amino acid--tRNA ligase-related protein [Candidatus Paceibacterota bacterium]|nr:amino acid--tRNA ligase-related protein [Candidatus Paceibacterota bacterium]